MGSLCVRILESKRDSLALIWFFVGFFWLVGFCGRGVFMVLFVWGGGYFLIFGSGFFFSFSLTQPCFV